MQCEICKANNSVGSAVIDGQYVKDICARCKVSGIKTSSGHARWLQNVDVEDHSADIMQPHNADGTLNTDFAKLYPEQAKAVFTEDDIAEAMRK